MEIEIEIEVFRPMYQTTVASRRTVWFFQFDKQIVFSEAWNSKRTCQWVRKHGIQPRVAWSAW